LYYGGGDVEVGMILHEIAGVRSGGMGLAIVLHEIIRIHDN
jgi:hypothetical protein